MNFLFFFNSIALGIGLAMDAFSVSLANGLHEPRMSGKRMCLIAGTYAFFQWAMPMLGWFLVRKAEEAFSQFQKFIPWIALGLLSWIGGKMLIEGIRQLRSPDPEDTVYQPLTLPVLLVQGIATAIDALSVGFTIESYHFPEALTCSLIIAAVTFVICMAGVIIGKKFGTIYAKHASIFGGLILIGIGLEIFITHFI